VGGNEDLQDYNKNCEHGILFLFLFLF